MNTSQPQNRKISQVTLKAQNCFGLGDSRQNRFNGSGEKLKSVLLWLAKIPLSRIWFTLLMTMHKRVKLLLLHGETEKEPKKIKRFHNLKKLVAHAKGNNYRKG
ncbi:MAG: hypothetical protein D4S01_04250, partial [Dehalococcoidia bacterium]